MQESQSRPVLIGDRAPHFVAATYQGERIDLEDFRGRKLWLAFFRFASCPLSNLRVHRIRRCYRSLFAGGLEILAIFQSPREHVAAYVGRQDPPFRLVADPDESLYLLYGVGAGVRALAGPTVPVSTVRAASLGFLAGPTDGTITRVPADFLIDERGIVSDVWRGKDVDDHIPLARVHRFLGHSRAALIGRNMT